MPAPNRISMQVEPGTNGGPSKLHFIIAATTVMTAVGTAPQLAQVAQAFITDVLTGPLAGIIGS
jgi:hypothetical protein